MSPGDRSHPRTQSQCSSGSSGSGKDVQARHPAPTPTPTSTAANPSPSPSPNANTEDSVPDRLLIMGINAAQDSVAISTFAHLFVVLCCLRFNAARPDSFDKGLQSISAPNGRDFVYVWKLNTFLSKIIAGDFHLELSPGNTVFDLIQQFPVEVKERVGMGIEEEEEEATKTRMKALEEEHEQGIEQGEVYLVSVNVLRFWLQNCRVFDKPFTTYWKFWAKNFSKQMLGEAIGFKLCLMHSMSCKAYARHGRTDQQSLQTFTAVQL